MARILYGVHGTGHGHAIRALTVARHFHEHEVLFISHGTGAAILQKEYPVKILPSIITVIRSHEVDLVTNTLANLCILLQSQRVLKQVRKIIDDFKPDVTITDYEYFVPIVSRRLGLPCLSLDNQHILTHCQLSITPEQRYSYQMTQASVRFLFSRASNFIITSFFQPPLKPNLEAKIFPPLLRDTVLIQHPADGEHVLAYQGYSTFKNFLPFLQSIPRPIMVYGAGAQGVQGNLHFKQDSEHDFLQDMASCRYVICGGSSCLISEALFLGKPILAFPIKHAFEQFLNAYYLKKLGWGNYCIDFTPNHEIISSFEMQLDTYRRNILQQKFCGNQEIFGEINQFIWRKVRDNS